MTGKRVLWRDRSGARVRERRRQQSRIMAATAQAGTGGVTPVAEVYGEVAASFDLASWLMLGSAGEAVRPREATVLEP